ncbi:hypothetical protein F4677DRAFT_462464 [Hypoxylon crocopeplum]|nr:hypothetical protein F4677DRAFT_462464 [Hypoxylon crocopeplum]
MGALPPRPLGVFGKEYFNAGRGLSVESQVSRGQLTVKGLILDRIDGTYEHPKSILVALWVSSLMRSGELSAIPESISSLLRDSLDVASWFAKTPYDDPVFAAAMALACGFMSGTSSKRAVDDLDAFRRNFTAFCAQEADITSQLTFGEADKRPAANPTNFRSAINIFCFGRHFIRSEKGYVGLGPVASRSGDYIVVFSGVAVPYIIRPVRGGCFKVIGH